MAYGFYLVLDQQEWFRGDFSDTNKLTGTIYTNKQLTTKANLTGYAIQVRWSKSFRYGDRLDKTASIVVAADGTWSLAIGEGEIPPHGIYQVKCELTQSGRRESTLNRVEILVTMGPTD